MSRHNQASYERTVFRAFAGSARLGIVPRTVRSAKPPRPDLTCRAQCGERLAFELVQVIDTGIAQNTNDQIRLQALLRAACDDLPRTRRRNIRIRLRNALVAVRFRPQLTWKARKAAVPAIIDVLETIDPQLTGQLPLADPKFRGALTRLNVSRGQFVGPCFYVAAGGPFGDPIVDLVRQKFSKSYVSHIPIELLAFYELQPISPDSLWLPKLQEFVRQNICHSPFRRVWVYDMIERKVRYAYPSPRRGGA